MPVTTIHNYIDQYPIGQQTHRLIIGTMHPHLIQDFNIDFFYGNIGSIWDILSNAFPNRQFGALEGILNTLQEYNIGITDIIRQCDREDEHVVADADLFNIIHNGEQIQDGIENSEIDTIFFTSRFGRNNAAKLFVDTFHINYQATFDPLTSEFTIGEEIFGRPIRAVVLYSPSNNANRGISRTRSYLNNIGHFQQFPNPVKQFKIEFYQQKFDFLEGE